MNQPNRRLQRSFYLLTAFFMAAGAATASDAYYTYRSLRAFSPTLAARQPAARFEIPKKKKKDYAVILRRNLFASTSLKGKRPKPSQLPKRSVRPRPRPARIKPLGFRLVGTTVGPQGVRYAIFQESKSRKHVIYGVGERVEGALIQGIERSEVHLLYGGEIKILRAFEGTPKKRR